MNDSHCTLVKNILEQSGYTFTKIDQHLWHLYDGAKFVAASRAIGDLVRNEGVKQGIW
jgi:hypothetical protein